VHKITGVNDLSRVKGVDVFLVFKQSEKSELARYGHNVFTVHEFQGQRARNVGIVRLSEKTADMIITVIHMLWLRYLDIHILVNILQFWVCLMVML